jgi:hypothetical protein
MGMVLINKLDPKEMLDYISIWTGVKRWAEAGGGDNGRSRQAGFVWDGMMEEVLDVYSSW